MAKGRGRAPRTNWQDIVKDNADWETYYKTLALPTSDDAEFEKYKETCRAELPVTFRITGTSRDVIEVREIMMERYIKYLSNQTWEGRQIDPPHPIPFYPDELAWEVNVAKQVIRRNPQFSEFQRFLVVETNAGNISRQEMVSMIPPLLMEVEPHHAVLDTCASPGSKTAQLIEALHRDPNPTGLVIANDSDYKRAFMLTHQVKRLNSPNVIVTNHDAQMYPKIWTGKEYLKFDRILCDVPCSGDATMRKNINVWKDWKVQNSQGLHNLQLTIATRSVHLLKSGGRLVYSTCSLNPIENEAVVAELLRKFPNLRLVDVKDKLPALNRSKGISNWKVQRTDKKWFDLDDTANLPRSWFRPSDEEASKFNLDLAVRVYPGEQNCGGFFIAVLELNGDAVEVKDLEAQEKAKQERELRSSEPPAKKVRTETQKSEAEPKTEDKAEKSEKLEEKPAKEPKLPRDIPAKEEPFAFLSSDNEEVQSCLKFYGINDSFRTDTLLVRNAEGLPTKTIYYVAPSLKPILEHKEQKLKVIHGGIRLFNAQKSNGECKWRVQSEGIAMLHPYASKRIVHTDNQQVLKDFCLESFIKFDAIKELDADLYKQIIDLAEGCVLWNLNGHVYPLWKGIASANLMIPKENSEELLLRLFNIDKKKLPQAEPKPVKKAEPETEPVAESKQ